MDLVFNMHKYKMVGTSGLTVGIVEDDCILDMIVKLLKLTPEGAREVREVQSVAKLEIDMDYPPDWEFNDIETSFGITVPNSEVQKSKCYMATMLSRALSLRIMDKR